MLCCPFCRAKGVVSSVRIATCTVVHMISCFKVVESFELIHFSTHTLNLYISQLLQLIFVHINLQWETQHCCLTVILVFTWLSLTNTAEWLLCWQSDWFPQWTFSFVFTENPSLGLALLFAIWNTYIVFNLQLFQRTQSVRVYFYSVICVKMWTIIGQLLGFLESSSVAVVLLCRLDEVTLFSNFLPDTMIMLKKQKHWLSIF